MYTCKRSLCTCFVANDGCTTNGDLRLQDGTVASEGRLEVCNSGSWTTFKASTVDYRVAQVVCRQLGYDPECKTLLLHVQRCTINSRTSDIKDLIMNAL